MKKLSFILAVLLAGCGGSGSDGGAQLQPSPDQVPPMADAFFAQVQTVVAAMPDDAEPASIDNLAAATAPEGSEPLAL